MDYFDHIVMLYNLELEIGIEAFDKYLLISTKKVASGKGVTVSNIRNMMFRRGNVFRNDRQMFKYIRKKASQK